MSIHRYLNRNEPYHNKQGIHEDVNGIYTKHQPAVNIDIKNYSRIKTNTSISLIYFEIYIRKAREL